MGAGLTIWGGREVRGGFQSFYKTRHKVRVIRIATKEYPKGALNNVEPCDMSDERLVNCLEDPETRFHDTR